MSAVPAPAAPFLADSYIFDWKAQSFRADFIFVLPMSICLGLGIWLGHPAAGLITAGGAFTVGFGAKQHIDESSLLPMILAALGISAATFVGMVAGHTNFILVLFAAGAGFVYGMLSLRQPGVSWVGQQSIVFLIVASAYPFLAPGGSCSFRAGDGGGRLADHHFQHPARISCNSCAQTCCWSRTIFARSTSALRESVEQAARALLKRQASAQRRPLLRFVLPSLSGLVRKFTATSALPTDTGYP